MVNRKKRPVVISCLSNDSMWVAKDGKEVDANVLGELPSSPFQSMKHSNKAIAQVFFPILQRSGLDLNLCSEILIERTIGEYEEAFSFQET